MGVTEVISKPVVFGGRVDHFTDALARIATGHGSGCDTDSGGDGACNRTGGHTTCRPG